MSNMCTTTLFALTTRSGFNSVAQVNNSKRTVRIHRIRFHFFFRFVRLFPHANGGRCYWMLLTGKCAQTQRSCRTQSIAIWLTHSQCGDASHYAYSSCWDYFNTRPAQLPILPLLLILSCFIQWISVFVDLSIDNSCLIWAVCLYWWCYAIISVYKKMIHCSIDYWMLSNWTLLALHNCVFFIIFNTVWSIN